MIIANKYLKENIVEYILYMWNIENLIRSCNFDTEVIEQGIIAQFSEEESVKDAMRKWYKNLALDMKDQRIQKEGHLNDLKEIMNELVYLHNSLLTVYQDDTYKQLYSEAAPNIQLLQKKAGHHKAEAIETSLNGVYGILLLRLQKKDINPETQEATDSISKMLAYLAKKYKDIKSGELTFPQSMSN